MGMLLQDLTLVEEGCPTHVSPGNDTAVRLVNFSKMKMVYQVVSQIQGLQSCGYRLVARQPVLDALLAADGVLDDNLSYRLSLLAEPRQQPQQQQQQQ